MVSKLEYNQIFKPAMETIFGKTLICRSLEIASQYARNEHMDCITLDGDQVSRRGALTGGYYDKRKSRLDSQRQVWYWQAKLQEEESNAGKIKGDMEEVDSELSKLVRFNFCPKLICRSFWLISFDNYEIICSICSFLFQ